MEDLLDEDLPLVGIVSPLDLIGIVDGFPVYIPGPQGPGVPPGGLDGQILAKASNDNYDTEWVNGGGGSGSVTAVNNVGPDEFGNVTLTPGDIGAATTASVTAKVSKSGDTMTGPLTLNSIHLYRPGDINDYLTFVNNNGFALIQSSQDLFITTPLISYTGGALAFYVNSDTQGLQISQTYAGSLFDMGPDGSFTLQGGGTGSLKLTTAVLSKVEMKPDGEILIKSTDGKITTFDTSGDLVMKSLQGRVLLTMPDQASNEISLETSGQVKITSTADQDVTIVAIGQLNVASYKGFYIADPITAATISAADISGDMLINTPGNLQVNATNISFNVNNGNNGIGINRPYPTTSFLDMASSTTSKTTINFGTGVAPSAPNDGDMWFDGADLYMQIGGVTKQFTMT